MRTAAELEAGTLVGGYRTEALVGRGGMGVVYQARQLTLDRVVALKLIAPELSADEQFRERFKREWRIAASLDHPNVLPIYEAGEVEGLLFLAMRHVNGQDLGTLAEKEGGLAPTRAAAIVSQVASALDAAHARGLVHRDVKPTNILLERRERSEHAYLADFGLARKSAEGSRLSRTGELVGTVDYVAPEQIRGERMDARSDVYALGCVLYQALTGRVPYPRDNELARLWAHMHEQPPAVTEALPDAPLELDEVVARALAKRPEDRYASAGDLGRAALAAVQGGGVGQSERSVARGEAAGAVVDKPGGRLAPVRSRRRLLMGVTGALLSLAVAVLLVVRVLPGASADAEERDRTESPSKPGVPGEVVGEPIPIDSGVEKIVVGEEGVWVSSTEGVARHIDPSLNEVFGLPVGLAPEDSSIAGRALAVGEGAVWLAAQNRVSRVDPQTHQVDEPIVFSTREDWGSVVAAGEGGVWIVAFPSWVAFGCSEEPELLNCHGVKPSRPRALIARVDPEAKQATTVGSFLISQPTTAGFPNTPVDVEIGEGAIWILVSDGTLRRIDPGTNVIGEPIRLGLGERNEPSALAVGDGTLWVQTFQETVVRVDASSGQLVGSPIPVSMGAERYPGLGFAFGEGSIWVTDISRNTVARIDADTRKMVGAPIEVPARPLDVAVGEGAVWVASELDQVVTRLDPSP